MFKCLTGHEVYVVWIGFDRLPTEEPNDMESALFSISPVAMEYKEPPLENKNQSKNTELPGGTVFV